MKNIIVTVASDANPQSIFNLLKTLGMHGANLNGNIITGNVAGNLVNPFRSVPGVANVEVSGEEKAHAPKPPPIPVEPPPLPVYEPTAWSSESET